MGIQGARSRRLGRRQNGRRRPGALRARRDGGAGADTDLQGGYVGGTHLGVYQSRPLGPDPLRGRGVSRDDEDDGVYSGSDFGPDLVLRQGGRARDAPLRRRRYRNSDSNKRFQSSTHGHYRMGLRPSKNRLPSFIPSLCRRGAEEEQRRKGARPSEHRVGLCDGGRFGAAHVLLPCVRSNQEDPDVPTARPREPLLGFLHLRRGRPGAVRRRRDGGAAQGHDVQVQRSRVGASGLGLCQGRRFGAFALRSD
mmetsp:Transcript_1838/g.5495  ORF Transcript_1838/g.5495 Transcript_1838/m.5495 type:complete len:252 (-) Transcript_1838:1345-2100(-)